MKTRNFTINFSDDSARIIQDAERQVTEILKQNLVGKTIAFRSHCYLDKNFKPTTFFFSTLIMNVEDVIYKPEVADTYCKPFLIKSNDRMYSKYYDIDPRSQFFNISEWSKNFRRRYVSKEVSFVGSKRADDLGNFGNIKNIVRCIPKEVVIVHSATPQQDLMKVYTHVDKEYYYIDYKKPINIVKINPNDPYGEEDWS